jgi:hypothetical protein
METLNLALTLAQGSGETGNGPAVGGGGILVAVIIIWLILSAGGGPKK